VNPRDLFKWMASILRRTVGHERFIPICISLGVALRLLWVLVIVATPISDFAWYHERGIAISNGLGYTEDGEATAYWPVGYPAFLGVLYFLFGESFVVAKFANVILSVPVLYLSYRVTGELFRSETTGRVALLLLALYPNHIAYSSIPSCEYLFLLLLMAGSYLLITMGESSRELAAGGLIFGLSCLVKPQALPIPIIVLLGLFLRSGKPRSVRRLVRKGFIVYLALIATIAPWIVRNWLVFDDVVYISNNGGVTLMIGNNPYANGTYIPFEGKVSSLLDLDGSEHEHEVDSVARDYAISYILEHPVKTLSLWPMKLYYMYREDVEGVDWNELSSDPESGSAEMFFWYYTGLAQNYYLFILALFLISLPLLWLRGNRPIPLVGVFVIAYFTAVSLATIGISRFHFPLVPWMIGYVSALISMKLGPAANKP